MKNIEQYLLALQVQDKEADRICFTRRQAMSLANTTIDYPEIDMNTNIIIKSIEANRAVMEAQIERLQKQTSALPNINIGSGKPFEDSLGDMLNGIVESSLSNAVNTLRDLYTTEQNVRSTFGNDQSHSPDYSYADESKGNVIDGEATVIKAAAEQ